MAVPSASEIILISVNHSITLMGKVWLIVMLFLRILVLLFAGYPLYQDEQERFVCNTIQPGCANVCYDLFSPVSVFRFWLVQLAALCVPYFVFIAYVVHRVSNGLAADLTASAPPFMIRRERFSEAPLVAEGFTGGYIMHLMFRTLLEAGFGAAHYYLFGFYIPRRFLCQHPPCTTQVDCYISRPTEKTVMLNFMLGVAALSLFLNALDFICAIKRSVRQKIKRKMTAEKLYEEKHCLLSGGGGSKGMDINAPPAQQDFEGEAGPMGGFRKRRGSGGGALASAEEPPHFEHPSLPRSQGSTGRNTNGNNGYSVTQEEPPDRNGSEVALCPPEPIGTPRSIRVSKRNRVKPPPPPRRDLGLHPGDGSAGAKTCTRRVGPNTLVELGGGAELQSNEDAQDKRSEWV